MYANAYVGRYKVLKSPRVGPTGRIYALRHALKFLGTRGDFDANVPLNKKQRPRRA